MERLSGQSSADLDRAAELLLGGKLVAVPTETVYGLAADARQDTAVRHIFTVKGRPLLDPLIVHLASSPLPPSEVEWPEAARLLADTLWPGPLTLVLRRSDSCPWSRLVSAGLPTVAIRVPEHPVLQELLHRGPLPLAAPSANPFGYLSPTTAAHVEEQLGGHVDAILDGGPCAHGVESTIVSLVHPERPTILRPGPVSRETLAHVLGIDLEQVTRGPGRGAADPQLAPGQLPSHYSPHTPLRLFPEGAGPTIEPEPGTARVFLQRPTSEPPSELDFWWSEDGDPVTIARSLFALLRRLDRDPRISLILAEQPSSLEGLEGALRDRLSRAAHASHS